jgi:DNA polymerase-3 subunit gamma/tau
MSFYSKYRPSKIQELDIEMVRNQLNAILKSGSFSHAYLFTGPRGTGKTSTARIIAKVLNCAENAPSLDGKATVLHEPCNACESCGSIALGSSLSVVEIDAASNRGIDDIRTLKEQIILAPPGGAFCVYIIDEVHMLTTEAFNALLKTIEEPPAHAIFILCTTESHKVPATIHSRCTRITFSRASSSEIVSSLRKAVTGETLTIENESLQLIAQSADGSFRDGMKLLEQLSKQSTTITHDMVAALTGYTQEYVVDQLIEALIKKDMSTALEQVFSRVEQGVDFVLLQKRLLESLRERLLKEIAKKSSANVSDYLRLIEHVVHYSQHQKNAPIAQLPLEMAIVSWCQESTSLPSTPPPIQPQKVAAPSSQTQKTTKPVNGRAGQTQETTPSILTQPIPPRMPAGSLASKSQEQLSQSNVSLSLPEIETKWPELLALVRLKNVSVEALLKAAKPANADGNTLTLEVLYAFHKEQLEQQRHRTMVEAMMASLFGGECRINLVLARSAAKAPSKDVVNVTGALEDEQVAQAVEEIFG